MFKQLYYMFWEMILFFSNRRYFKSGQTCQISGKYFRLKNGIIVNDDIDVEKEEQFPPCPEKGMVYVLYRKHKN